MRSLLSNQLVVRLNELHPAEHLRHLLVVIALARIVHPVRGHCSIELLLELVPLNKAHLGVLSDLRDSIAALRALLLLTPTSEIG